MAQMVSPGGPRSALSGVLTVADLLKRTEAVPVVRDAVRGATARVSVGSLLRRESVAGGKAAPKDSPNPAAETKPSSFISGKRVARGSAIAVGTLLTAGSVFGTVAVTETSHTTSNDGLGGHPGQGRLDQAAATPQAQLPGAATALAQPAAAGALDPGHAAPDSWVQVAFPSAQAAAPASTPAAPGAQGAATTPDRPSTPATTPRHQAPAPAAAPAATPAAAEAPAPSQPQGGGLVDGLTKTVDNLGETAPVLKPVTSPVSSLLGGGGGSGDEGSSSESRSSAPSSSSSSSPSNGGGGLLGSLGKTVGGLLG